CEHRSPMADPKARFSEQPDLAVEPRLNLEEAGTSGDTYAPEMAAGEWAGRPASPVTPGAAGCEDAHPQDQMPGDPLGPHRSPVRDIGEGGSDLLCRIMESRWSQLATSASQGAVRSLGEAGPSGTEKTRVSSHSISVGGDSWISPHPCGEG